MKAFLPRAHRRWGRGGFSLAESTISLGVISCAIVTLAPILTLGLKTSRTARDDTATPGIVRLLAEEARQGTLSSGTLYADQDGRICPTSAGSAYCVQAAIQTLPGSISRLTLRVAPVGDPQRPRLYAVVYPTAPTP